MAILDIELPDDLLAEVNQLAINQYGGSGETSQSKVVESALIMRFLWFQLLNKSDAADKDEVEEPITKWEFDPEEVYEQPVIDINNWLFRRG